MKKKGRNIVVQPQHMIMQPVGSIDYRNIPLNEYIKSIKELNLSDEDKDKLIDRLREKFKHLNLEG